LTLIGVKFVKEVDLFGSMNLPKAS
jgi:hypothetical protein